MTTPTQPPDKCPVCLETLVDRASAAFVTFVCGQVMYLDEGGEWKPQPSWECVCERAQQIAIALRAERDALLRMSGARESFAVWKELEQARSKLVAALARLAELQAVCDATT